MGANANRRTSASRTRRNFGKWLLAKPNWWVQFAVVAAISTVGLVALGTWTYTGAPPKVAFVSATTGETVIPLHRIRRGQELFHIRGLMAWGSFSADALHRTVLSMRAFYEAQLAKERPLTQADRDAITVRVAREIKANGYDEEAQVIRLNDAQIQAYRDLEVHYTRMFTDPS